MNSALKQRLVGAIVLIAIGVLVVPSFLRDRQVEPVSTQTLIPDRPAQETMTFEAPAAPENVEAAPDPDTMFMPEESGASQPVVDSLEEAQSETDKVAEKEAPEPEASPSETAADDSAAWVVQVASFRSTDTARALRDRLQEDGYRAYVRSATTSGGEVSRVYIGPKISRSEAEATKTAVDQALKVDALVLRFEP